MGKEMSHTAAYNHEEDLGYLTTVIHTYLPKVHKYSTLFSLPYLGTVGR